MAGFVDMDALVPAWFACRRLGVSKQTFRSWVSSGKLTPVAGSGSGHPQYRYGDVLAVERETRNSRKSSRNPRRGGEVQQ